MDACLEGVLRIILCAKGTRQAVLRTGREIVKTRVMLLARRFRLVVLSLIVAMSGLDLSVLAEPPSAETSIEASGHGTKRTSFRRAHPNDEIEEDTSLVDPNPDELDSDDFSLMSETELALEPEARLWGEAALGVLGFPPSDRLFRPPRALVS
jgi:hypothetical protein